MKHLPSGSSGNLLLDRRLDVARALAAAGDGDAAIEIMSAILELQPDWPLGWVTLGDWCAERGDIAGARAAHGRALELDPADALGAGLRLDRLGAVSPGMTPRFVEALFDQYAERFDHALVDTLSYAAPKILTGMLAGAGAPGRVMDIGCGTGLMGEALRSGARWLEGVDLSASMLARAAERRIYDRLHRADFRILPASGDFDTVTAADVLIYVPALDKAFAAVAGMLRKGGVFAFSVERLDDGDRQELRATHRYAHGDARVGRELDAAGFAVAATREATLRLERAMPVEGRFVVAIRR